MNRKILSVAIYGLLLAVAFAFSFIEVLIPFNLGIPGVKLGLANLVVVVMLACLPWQGALTVSVLRILLSGLLFGGPSGMLYALAGGLCSFAVMALLLRCRHFSLFGVSMAGGLAHNFGQLAVAIWATQTARIVWYLPVLIISGVTTGALIGLAASLIIPRLPKRFLIN